MATSLRLMVLVCAAVAVFAQDLLPQEVPELILPAETLLLNQNVEEQANSNDQSVLLGECTNKPMYNLIVDIPKGFFQIKKHDMVIPEVSSDQIFYIRCIHFVDQLKNGKNAHIKVSSGGVGKTYAIVNMRSQRGGPINYRVIIDGYYKT